MRRAFFGGIAAVALGGCTLLVDTDDLTGGALAGSDGGSGDARTGGSSGDAGLPDGGEGGLADGGGAACPSDALLCADFENAFGQLQPYTTTGKLEVVSDIVHGGTHAFRATAYPREGSEGNQAELRLYYANPKKAGATIYFRAYVYFPERLPPETTISKWRTGGSEDMNLKIDAEGRWKIDADLATEGPELSGPDIVPTGQWLCVDWRATLGAPGHELLRVDGKTHIDADENNVSATGYTELGIGFVTSDFPQPVTVLFDDVIVSESPVGCP